MVPRVPSVATECSLQSPNRGCFLLDLDAGAHAPAAAPSVAVCKSTVPICLLLGCLSPQETGPRGTVAVTHPSHRRGEACPVTAGRGLGATGSQQSPPKRQCDVRATWRLAPDAGERQLASRSCFSGQEPERFFFSSAHPILSILLLPASFFFASGFRPRCLPRSVIEFSWIATSILDLLSLAVLTKTVSRPLLRTSPSPVAKALPFYMDGSSALHRLDGAGSLLMARAFETRSTDERRQLGFITGSSVMAGVALVFVLMRIVSRFCILRRPGIDDCLLIASAVSASSERLPILVHDIPAVFSINKAEPSPRVGCPLGIHPVSWVGRQL